jgi:beta-lactamase class D
MKGDLGYGNEGLRFENSGFWIDNPLLSAE